MSAGPGIAPKIASAIPTSTGARRAATRCLRREERGSRPWWLAGARGAARGGAPRRSPSQLPRVTEHQAGIRCTGATVRIRARERRSRGGALLVLRVPVGLRLCLHDGQARVVVRELVQMRSSDLRGHGHVVVGDVGLDIMGAMLELDVHPHPELLNIKPR